MASPVAAHAPYEVFAHWHPEAKSDALGSRESLYLRFAALDPKDTAVLQRFANRWGCPMYFNDVYTEWPPICGVESVTYRYPVTLFRLEVKLMAAVLTLVSSHDLADASRALALVARTVRDWLGAYALSYMKLGFVYPIPESFHAVGRPYELVRVTPLFFAFDYHRTGRASGEYAFGGVYCSYLQVFVFRNESEALTIRRRLVATWGDDGSLATPDSICQMFQALNTPAQAKAIRKALNDDHHVALVTSTPLDELYSWADRAGGSEVLSKSDFEDTAELLLDMVTRTPNDWRLYQDWRFSLSSQPRGGGLVNRTVLPSLRDALWAMLLADTNGGGLRRCAAGQRCLGTGYFTGGRANRRFCSKNCRQAASRSRH